MRGFLLILAGIFPFLALRAEEARPDVPEVVEDILAQIVEDREEGDWSFMYENFMALAGNPLNLNTATRTQLEDLYFLSAEQIENLLYYIYKYGAIFSEYELPLIDGFDERTVRNLLPFVTFSTQNEDNSFPLEKFLKKGRHDFYSRTRRTVERQAGFRHADAATLAEKPNAKYLGGPYAEMFRYTFNAYNRLTFGLTAEKDAGEKCWGARQRVFDFYSPYLQIDKLWKFNRIVVGSFRASFGMGLLLNTNFSMGKSSYVTNVFPKSSGIARSASSNEYNFLRGAAASVALSRKWNFTAFYSDKKLDAVPLPDGTGFSSLKTDGMHRTERELGQKNLLRQQVAGANVSFQHSLFKIGVTGLSVLFDKPLRPNANSYNQHAFSGRRQHGLSADYSLNLQKWKFFGETAWSFSGRAAATLNGVVFSPISRVRFIAAHRYYSEKYQAIFANSFSANSAPANETGAYVGVEMQPYKHWRVAAYFDSYRFPWLKNGVSMPSTGKDALAQAEYNPWRDIVMSLRFRYKENEKNAAADGATLILPYTKKSLRYTLKYKIAENFRFQNAVEWNRAKSVAGEKSDGFAFLQTAALRFPARSLSLDVHYVFFDTRKYENRIAFYEADVLYVFSVPALYGKGNRVALLVTKKFGKNFSCSAKAACTKYFDRSAVGSDLSRIDAPHRTDLTLLLRYVFR